MLHASELGSLPKAAPGTKTIVLGPFSRRISVALPNGGAISGTENTLETVLERAASGLGGTTLSGLPGDIGTLTPSIQGADRIIFFTAGRLGPLTQAEMDLIQSSPTLMGRTTFVYGGMQ